MDWTLFCSLGNGADGDKKGFGCFLFGSELVVWRFSFTSVAHNLFKLVRRDVQLKQVIFDASCGVSEAVFIYLIDVLIGYEGWANAACPINEVNVSNPSVHRAQ